MRVNKKLSNYVLYKLDDEDIDINSVTGSHYIKNRILIFSSEEQNIKCGNEIRACKNLEEAKIFIEQNAIRKSIRDTFQIAKERAEANREVEEDRIEKECTEKERIR